MRRSLLICLFLCWPASVRADEVGLCLLTNDCDADGLGNSWETGCGSNRSDSHCEDTDGDLIRDPIEANPTAERDSDNDGTIDSCDDDSDDDGITDRIESGCTTTCGNPVDTDGDMVPDYRDPDSDDDGRSDLDEGTEDDDADGLANWRDANDRDGPLGDLDGDTVLNPNDNCPSNSNQDQLDTDADQLGDACDVDDDDDGLDDATDNCPLISNAGQSDNEGDDIGDVCDPDDDNDLVNDDVDNCPIVSNPGQEDADTDNIGDACDIPGDRDDDGDSVLDDRDNCLGVSNMDQADLDGDRMGDACDTDDDDDGLADSSDNCAVIPNNDQADLDRDGTGDACDEDDDDDLVDDAVDVCPRAPDPGQEDVDDDGIGDVCDPDDDMDGIDDGVDNCLGIANPTQVDDDRDGHGDECDTRDSDGDGVEDSIDNCRTISNRDQADTDQDGFGNACDDDQDGDTFLDATSDNCPQISNDQSDLDGDGAGDPCDPDADGDGVSDDRESLFGTDPLDATDLPIARGGGCQSARGSIEVPLLLLLAFASLIVRRRALLSIALIAVSSSAYAQVDAQLLRPAPIDRGGAAVEGTEVLPPFGFQAAVWGGHAGRPVEIVDNDGQRIGSVIDGLSTVDLRLTLGLPAAFEISTLLPVQVVSSADGPASISGAGIGDWSVSVKWLALDHRTYPVGLSARAELFLPTGDRDRLGGDGKLGGAVTLGIDGLLGPVLLAANVGGRFRDGVHRFEGAAIGQQLTYGAVADWEIIDDLHAAGEVYGAYGFDRDGASPIEALGSLRYRVGPVLFAAGGGSGLNDALGNPQWRVFGAVGLSIEPTDEKADADGDGIVDAHDPCLELAEDRDGFQDNDGCPDPDNDEDGVVDTKDACVGAAEDADGFEDSDGCPDNDDDGDAIVDAKDSCPRAPENVNRFQDEDGCPDTAPTYVFAVGERLVFNDIQFQTNSYELLVESYPVLDEIVKSLQEQPDVRIRVEGHTDGEGDPKGNLVLSQQRALSVLNYLVSAGVDAKRVEHAGYGDTRPVAGNDTPEERAQNRRVELVTLERIR
jgi:outer membrane protein OmpA-like peptidoglycan-associated protein